MSEVAHVQTLESESSAGSARSQRAVDQTADLFVCEVVKLDCCRWSSVAPKCAAWGSRNELARDVRTDSQNGLCLVAVTTLQCEAVRGQRPCPRVYRIARSPNWLSSPCTFRIRIIAQAATVTRREAVTEIDCDRTSRWFFEQERLDKSAEHEHRFDEDIS